MKKLALAATLVFSTLLNVNALAAPTLGKEYIEVRPVASAQKEVIEFFSFYCPHCNDFELVYQIPHKIKADLPQDSHLVQYHVNFLGRQSENLTRAWGLAMALGAEENVKKPLFEAAQKDALHSMEDIRAIFLANGVTAEQFDGGINSFAVTALFNKQIKLAEELKVRGVPAFFVNEQYQLQLEGFSDVKSNDEFVKRYVEAVTFLARK